MARVSIVIPVYYNARSLPSLWERLAAVADSQRAYEFEFIFVDDGSGDDSWAVMNDLAGQDGRILLVRLARNFGSGAAILAGMECATGDCVGFVAADLQDPPETLAAMLARWKAGDKVVFAVRRDRQGDPPATRLFAGFFNWLLRKLVFPNISPHGIGFFLVDRQVADVVIHCEERNTHLIGLVLWTGFKYGMVEYDRSPRRHGRSRWTFARKLKYFIDAFVAFSYFPLRLASALGLLLSLLGGVYAVVVIAVRLSHPAQVAGWSALMVVVLLMSGIQLVMLGVIGEYLWRNLDAARRRPLFIVDSVVRRSSSPGAGPTGTVSQ
jgi:polyisoprenyl-phosphate glycosyltransferase